jgi:predicted amidohydrolase
VSLTAFFHFIPANMSIIIAAYQFTPGFLLPEENIGRIVSAIRTTDADYYVIPELSTTGYFFTDRDEAMAFAEPRNGGFCSAIRDLAVDRQAVIIAGFAERDGDVLYNSATIALPDGNAHIYRKIHLFAEEKSIFEPGDAGFFVLRHRGVCFGTMICYDWRFPESVRTLSLKGAQIIFHPSNLVALPSMWGPVMQTRSLENKVFTVTANRTGTETRGEDSLVFHGCSQITNVNGAILSQTDESTEGWITADIDPDKALNKRFSKWNDIFADRRPETYEL